MNSRRDSLHFSIFLTAISARHDNVAVELPESASRSYLDSGYEAFLFTPRGVFRPGETVDVKAFVRDKTLEGVNRFSLVLIKPASRNAVFSFQAMPIPQPK